jgi:hypothetical protein
MKYALAAWLGLVLPFAAVAQRPAPRPFDEGTHAFRAVLNQQGVRPVTSIDQVDADPAHSMVIALGHITGTSNRLGDDVHGLRWFLDNGGAVLIATDRPTPDWLFERFGVRVTGTFLRAPDGFCYRGMADCPFLEPPENDITRPRILGQWLLGRDTIGALFAGTDHKVATNRPSHLEFQNSQLPVVANVPAFRQYTSRRLPDGFIPLMEFAAGGPVGKGRLLVVADHSVFINEMLLQPDNDNITFALNVGRWLADPAGANRTSALFIEDGVIRSNFDVPLEAPRPSLPPLEALVPLADQALLALERDNYFNQSLLRAVLMRTLLLLATLALLAYGLTKLVSGRFRADAHLPRGPVPAAAHAQTPYAMHRRQEAQLRSGDLAEAARELARETLAAVGAGPGARVVGPWGWPRRVEAVARLAADVPAGRVTPVKLQRLARELDELRSAVAVGVVRFVAPGGTA